MKKFLSNNNWWFYFILTYLISWPIWILGKVLLPENLTIITFIAGAFGPFIASLIILKITGDGSGVKEWLIYFVYLISTTLLTGGNEEPGWRGYVTPVLMERFHPVIVCTIVGTGWAVWHLPMYFLVGWGGNDQ